MMKSLLICLLILGLVLGIQGISLTGRRYWTKGSSPAAASKVNLTFLMKSQNTELLKSLLETVSDPDSPQYGKYLTLEQVAKLTSIPESIEFTKSFLKDNGATNIVVIKSGDFITADLPVHAAEKLLSTKLHVYSNLKNYKQRIVRAEKYTLPAVLAAHVGSVPNIDYFPIMKQKVKFQRYGSKTLSNRRKLLQAPADSVTPQLIAKYYNIASSTVASDKATQGVFETIGQSVDWSDLSAFFSMFNIPPMNVTIIGPNSESSCASDPNNCDESLLDTEWIMSVAQGAPTTWYSIDGSDPTPFLDFLKDLSNDANAPLVNSISYGGQEDQTDPSVAAQFDTVIQKFGVRGLTILVASGDTGVTGTDANGNFECGFFPNYPVSSPYVVAVGATQGPESGQPEIGCSTSTGAIITSGGGFSSFWDTPSYQKTAVATYLKNSKVPAPSNGYNATGRGYPDVSMMGHTYNLYDGGALYQGDGTSASTPVFAAVLTLINGLRFQAGKSAVGFVNPALYKLAVSTPAAFHDITSGINNCGENDNNGNPQCCTYGFPAVVGWDAMTGLGSVDFGKLSAAFLALP